MSRKHFNEIADAIFNQIPDEESRRKLAESLCDFFKAQNQKFQRDRFIDACTKGRT